MDKESNKESMQYGEDYRYLPLTSIQNDKGQEIGNDLWCHTLQIVNICFIGSPNTDNWVLVDAGMPGSSDAIIEAAEKRFGSNNKPQAIILTHGHFDHVGAVIELIHHWQIPVYAHELEMPYLTGSKEYPPGDTTTDGGLVSALSFLFPNEPVNLGEAVQALPANGTVPGLPEWRWIHTPGHTVGHISLFREKDRALIAGDAFVTVKQESLYKVVTQTQEISGPPRYFTTDWISSRRSVETLATLNPSVAITGHGLPMEGEELNSNLRRLADQFEEIAVPSDESSFEH